MARLPDRIATDLARASGNRPARGERTQTVQRVVNALSLAGFNALATTEIDVASSELCTGISTYSPIAYWKQMQSSRATFRQRKVLIFCPSIPQAGTFWVF
jgi:hypothetical protein